MNTATNNVGNISHDSMAKGVVFRLKEEFRITKGGLNENESIVLHFPEGWKLLLSHEDNISYIGDGMIAFHGDHATVIQYYLNANILITW